MVAVSGIPRGLQHPREDGNWLQDAHRRRILAVSPRIRLREIPAHAVEDVDGIEVLLAEGGNRTHYPGELDRADYERFFTPSLRWVQVCSAGFSDNITPEILDGRVTLTNATGLHTVPIAESVLGAMLAHAKNLRLRRRDQDARAWRRLDNDELHGRTVLIIGLGSIGGTVARLCKAFGMGVIGTRRRAAPVEGVDRVFPAGALASALPEADYVVIAAPHTRETEGLLGPREIARMKPTAYLVNVGRGRVVDEGALVSALASGKMAGAYLDAFVEEPLPVDHPLWGLPNVTIVPHDSHSSPFIGDRMVAIFCENLERYAAGEPLANVCDPTRGY